MYYIGGGSVVKCSHFVRYTLSLIRYTLSDETKQSLKTPGFDVWQWEPNEVKTYI